MTQGRDEAECGCSEWVTEYTLSYSLCGSFWSDYKANGSVKVRCSFDHYLCTCRHRLCHRHYHYNHHPDISLSVGSRKQTTTAMAMRPSINKKIRFKGTL